MLLMYRFGRLVVLVYIRKPCSTGPGQSEGPEPVSHGSSDPMSEPVSRARGDTLDARYIECARPTGGSHGLTIDDATQRFKGAKRRAAPAVIGESSAASSEEVRVRNQVGKESARPRALLYVVPKVCASATWPFMKASPHPDKPGTPKSGCSYRWAKQRPRQRRVQKARPRAV